MKASKIVVIAGIICLVFFQSTARDLASDPFYDINTIQKIELFFARSDWDHALDSLKATTDGYFKADSVVINGTKFENVGVKYKGNSSYDSTFIKNPFHIALDQYQSQSYQGFKTIKLANCYQDPSMIREVLSYNIIDNYMDAPQANFAKVYVNGNYLGLYSNTEAINKTFLSNHFNSSSNAYFECSPVIVPGPTTKSSLRYISADSTAYSNFYELKSTYGWNQLVVLCDTISNHTDRIGAVIDMDRVIWMLAFDNAVVNLDSYIGLFSQNWVIYKDKTGRFDPIVWDFNMSFGGFPYLGSGATGMGTLSIANEKTLTPIVHSTDSNWPLLKAVMNNSTYRKIYFAHIRTIVNEFFANDAYENLAKSMQTLIDSAVSEDENKFFSYENFQNSLTSSMQTLIDSAVSEDENKFFSYENFQNSLTSDISIGSYLVPGITSLINARVSYLQSNIEFAATPPSISSILPETASPVLNDSVIFRATVQNATSVNLNYRYGDAAFTSYVMYDDGNHNDGAANDGVYGVKVKVGELNMQYYAYAENAAASSLLPARAEFQFYTLTAQSSGIPQKGDVVINEFMADNTNGITNPSGLYSDWIELYNNTNTALDLSGLYISDNFNKPTKSVFPANTIIQQKSFLTIWADQEAPVGTEIHADFNLSKSGEQIIISNGAGYVIDSLSFGAQTANISMGRCPDGTGNFVAMPPTFGIKNICTSGFSQVETNHLTVFPNPANSTLQIVGCLENETLSIYNLLGKIIFQQPVIGNQLVLSVNNWKTGIYFAKQVNQIQRFIIKQ